jgi:hypothetical protein
MDCTGVAYSPRVVVCRDKIRLAMGHRWNSYVEEHVAAVATTMTRALLMDHDVLLDETHTTKDSIRRALLLDSSANFYFIDTPKAICRTRAKETGQEDLLPVIDRIHANLYRLLDGTYFEMDWDVLKRNLPNEIEKIRKQVVDEQQLVKFQLKEIEDGE